ncbi:MAG: PEPxxWA-CTERM sorting domain-containing protein [Pontixanthobacter sp.]
MTGKFFAAALTATLMAGVAAPASAAEVLSVTTPTAAGNSFSFDFDADGGDAFFDLMTEALGTVDGVTPNPRFQDTFVFSLNGSEFFRGSFNLGGSGTNRTFIQPLGSQVSVARNNGRGNGGTLDLTTPLTLIDGSNNLTFNLLASGSDEQFRITSLSVNTPDVNSAVPEPATWAMMMLGMFMVGGVMRARKAQQPKVVLSYS